MYHRPAAACNRRSCLGGSDAGRPWITPSHSRWLQSRNASFCARMSETHRSAHEAPSRRAKQGTTQRPVVYSNDELMTSRIVALCALSILVAGCAAGPGRPSSGADRAMSDDGAAHVARVVCEQGATVLETPVVRAHSDGVRFAIENPGRFWGVALHHESWGRASEGIHLEGPFDVTTATSAIPPGDIIVACLKESVTGYDDPGTSTAWLTVVDPEGLYVPWNPACGFGEQFRMRIEATENERAADVFRTVPGVLPSDEFKVPKYPESPQYWPTFMVYRQDEAIARIMGPYREDTGEWHLLINVCPGSGISKK
jgi:hypothetical protein